MPSEIIKTQDRPEQRQATSNVSLQQPASFFRIAILVLLAQACAGNSVPVRGQQAETRQAQQQAQPEPVTPEPAKTVSPEETRDQRREREEQRERDAENSSCHLHAPVALHQAELEVQVQRRIEENERRARAGLPSVEQEEALRRRACFDHVRNLFLSCIARGNTLPSLIPTDPNELERRCHETYEAQRAQCNR